MSVVDKLVELAADRNDEFAQVVREKGDFKIVDEKLHSMAQWLRLFMKSYEEYDYSLLYSKNVDVTTIELINYISICNGILDVSDGLFHVASKYFTNVPRRSNNKDFTRSRKANKKHDSHFKFNKNDKDYFKHSRAIFGQHPSNLNYPDEVKGFASWTFNDGRNIWGFDSDMYCNIYFDQEVSSYGIKFHVYYDEVRAFTETQIKYIDQLISLINKEVMKRRNKDCKAIGDWDENLELENKIAILKREIEIRYVIKEYHYLLHSVCELEEMLQANRITNYEDKYSEYLSYITNSIDEVYMMVSKCEQGGLEYFEAFSVEITNAIGNTYYQEKVSMYLIGQYRYHDIFKTVMDRACEKLGVETTHLNPDFYFVFYILKSIGEVAIEPEENYTSNKYTTNVVLGIDAAWTETQPSGVCLLKDDSYECVILKLSSSYDGFIKGDDSIKLKPLGSKPEIDNLINACNGETIDCIAIDMPLSNQLIEGRRSSERTISSAYGGKGAATHSPTSERPGKISLDLVNDFKEVGYKLSLANDVIRENALIEVYPHASIIEYLELDYRLPYKVGKKNSYKAWKHLLPEERTKKIITNLNMLIERLGRSVSNVSDFIPILDIEEDYNIWQLKAYEDMIDALICALTGLSYVTGNIRGYGEKDGTIWVPNKI